MSMVQGRTWRDGAPERGEFQLSELSELLAGKRTWVVDICK